MTSRAPFFCRLGALVCGLVYLPLGLVWAYGLALVALLVFGVGLWLLRRADRLDRNAGNATTRGQVRLRMAARWVLFAGLGASIVSFALTR